MLVFYDHPYGHAEVVSIDTSAAAASSGVITIYTGAEAQRDDFPVLSCLAKITCKDGEDFFSPKRPALITDRVRFVGDLIAMIIAETPEQALEAVELIDVSYNELPAVTDTDKAADPNAPQIWPGCENNTCAFWENHDSLPVDKIFKTAHKIATVDVVNSRVMGSPLEPRVALSEYEPSTGRVIHYAPTQGVHRHYHILHHYLPTMTKDDVRIVSKDVGGGFGLRGKFYPESALLIWACKRLKRNLK